MFWLGEDTGRHARSAPCHTIIAIVLGSPGRRMGRRSRWLRPTPDAELTFSVYFANSAFIFSQVSGVVLQSRTPVRMLQSGTARQNDRCVSSCRIEIARR